MILRHAQDAAGIAGLTREELKMAYAIRRKDPDGSDEVIAYVDDARGIGTAIDEDRRKID